MLGATLVLATVLGCAFAPLVLRADPRRWDNRVFAAVGITDALMNGYRALMVLSGHKLSDTGTLLGCTAGAATIAWLSLEFAWSFPFNRPLAARYRVAILAWAAAALALCYYPPTRVLASHFITAVYFAPIFVLMCIGLRRNLRRVAAVPERRRGIELVALAMISRWTAALFAYGIAPYVSAAIFDGALAFEATVSNLVAYLLIIHAFLRGTFSVRGVVARVLFYEAMALCVVALTALAVEAALYFAPGPVALRVLLVAAAGIPVAVLAIGGRVGGRLERMVVRNIDPRGAHRRDVLDRTLEDLQDADLATALARVRAAMSEITDGGEARFLRAAAASDLPSDAVLPETVAASLATDAHPFHSRRAPAESSDLDAAGADLLVPVRSRGRFLGALAVTGGRIDRDAAVVASALAAQLGLQFENYGLFAQLESSRRLATLGSFAAAIAHDIRTPLTSVQMNVQILRGKAQAEKRLGHDDMEHFDIALDELRRLNGNITELLDYAKPVKLAAAPLDVGEVAEDVARRIEPMLGDRKQTLATDLAAGLPPLHGDAERIRQVLWNLLDNAVKASADGAAIVLRTRALDEDRVAIEVADSGRGIAADHLPRIFEPFFTTRPDGTGLGLAICQKLVRAHDGEIQVSSTLGKGTTFSVVLPVRPPTAAPAPATATERYPR
jgi:signal transduction histidine kinase